MKKELLLQYMECKGDTLESLAKLLGINKLTLYKKIKYEDRSFKLQEIEKIRKHYKLSPQQITELFL